MDSRVATPNKALATDFIILQSLKKDAFFKELFDKDKAPLVLKKISWWRRSCPTEVELKINDKEISRSAKKLKVV